jgi:hypothetical protein
MKCLQPVSAEQDPGSRLPANINARQWKTAIADVVLISVKPSNRRSQKTCQGKNSVNDGRLAVNTGK